MAFSVQSPKEMIKWWISYRASTFVDLVSKRALLFAIAHGRTSWMGGFALAKGAIVLIHKETVFTVKITLELRTDDFVLLFAFLPLLIFSRVCRNTSCRIDILAATHTTTTLVFNKLTIQSTMRQLWANLFLFICNVWQFLQTKKEEDIIRKMILYFYNITPVTIVCLKYLCQ